MCAPCRLALFLAQASRRNADETVDAGAAEPLVVVGDVLFAGSIGRTDLMGGSFPVLERSIREQLYTLPDATRVICGHGPETTIGRERASNPFVAG